HHAGGALAVARDPLDADIGVDAGTEVQRARHVRDERRLLRAGRAAERAAIAADAVRLVAQVADDLPALGVGALLEQLVVVADRLFIHAGDVDAPLDALEVRLHRLGRDVEALALPAREDLLGGAPRHAAVDHRRAADRAAVLVHHRRVADRHRRAAVAVQLA